MKKNYWFTGTEKGQKRADKSSYEMRDTRYEIRDAKRAKKQINAEKGRYGMRDAGCEKS